MNEVKTRRQALFVTALLCCLFIGTNATMAEQNLKFKAHIHESIGVEVSPGGLLITSSHVEYFTVIINMRHDLFKAAMPQGSCSSHSDIHAMVNETVDDLNSSYAQLFDTEYNTKLL